MSLNKKITQFRITANGNDHDINIQNMSFKWSTEYYYQPRTSVGGRKLASNSFAGKRLMVELNYNASIEASSFDSMINDIYADFIYNNVDGVKFYPNADETSDVAIANYTGWAGYGFSVGNDTITIPSNGFLPGQYVKYDDTNVTLSGDFVDGAFYYIYKIDADDFALTQNINKTRVDLTNLSGTGDFLYEVPYVEVIPMDLTQLQDYQSTIGKFRPTIQLQSVIRYVSTPTIFANSN